MVQTEDRYCERCKSKIYFLSKLHRCSKCSRMVCSSCLRFYITGKGLTFLINGMKRKKEDLLVCLDCPTDFDCHFCKIQKPQRTIFDYSSCFFCEAFVCNRHSHNIYGIFKKYGMIVICKECFETKKCVKCEKPLSESEDYYESKFNKKHEITCGSCLQKRREKGSRVLSENMKRHMDLQQVLFGFFKDFLGCNVQSERQLEEYGVVDLIVHAPKSNDLYGFEIKTGTTDKKFQLQLSKYDKYFDYFYILVKKSELDKCLKYVKKEYGILIVNDDETNWSFYREATRRKFTLKDLLNNMKGYGLFWLCVFSGVKAKPTEIKRMKRDQKIRAIIKNVKSREKIKLAYVEYVLKKRYVSPTTLTNKEWEKLSGRLKQKTLEIGNQKSSTD